MLADLLAYDELNFSLYLMSGCRKVQYWPENRDGVSPIPGGVLLRGPGRKFRRRRRKSLGREGRISGGVPTTPPKRRRNSPAFTVNPERRY